MFISTLLITLDCPLQLPQVTVGNPQFAKYCPLAATIADLAYDRQRLLIVFDGLLEI